jgi:hypothetical protein
MAITAQGFARVPGRAAVAAGVVHCASDSFKVRRAHTPSIPAEVVNLQTRWDRPYPQLVCQPVSVTTVTHTKHETAVGIAVWTAAEIPASCNRVR